MPQPFLHAGQNRFVIAGLDMDHAIRRQTGLLQPRSEQILLGHTPQYLSLRPRRDPGDETRRCRPVHRPIAAARDLMQAAKRQSAARQSAVKRLETKRQHLPQACALPFKL